MSFTYILKSDTYGEIVMRAIAVLDTRALKLKNEDDLPAILYDYGPKGYFVDKYHAIYSFFKLEEGNLGSAVVCVAVHEDNLDWKPLPESSYYETWKKRKKAKPPFTVSEANVNKWLGKVGDTALPEYFVSAKNIEEVRANFNKHYDL